MKGLLLHIIFLFSLAIPVLAQSGYENSSDAFSPDTVTIKVLGTHDDSRFEPAWVEIRPGDVVRFEVKEGIHTVTAYHPNNRRDLGIPKEADSFDSGVLSGGDVWFLKISIPGEYNYFCLPHERMGHTGTIVASNDEFTSSIE